MSLANPPRLFIPGPVQVEDEVLQQMARPMIGHRAPEFMELMGPIHEKLQCFFYTDGPAFACSISATGIMEGAVKNCVRERVLCCVNGAFSQRWFKICESNGIAADRLDFEWGAAVKPDQVGAALATGKYDAVTVVHNETSTGVMSPLAEITKEAKKHGDIAVLVDAVTSLAVVPINFKELGVDVLLAGSQKGLAMPPGLTVFAVSELALERARAKEHRGTYTDFLAILKSHGKNQTPNTPSISHLYALDYRLTGILNDTEKWYGDHQARADLTREWVRDRFELFPEEGYESVSLTCVKNTRDISIADLNNFLRERNVIISNGYGDLKEKTFRISHMGANDLDAHKQLFEWIDEFVDA